MFLLTANFVLHDVGELLAAEYKREEEALRQGSGRSDSLLGSSWLAETETPANLPGDAFARSQDEYEGTGNMGKELGCEGDVDCIRRVKQDQNQ